MSQIIPSNPPGPVQPTRADTTTCRLCGNRILWAKYVKNQKAAPLVPEVSGKPGAWLVDRTGPNTWVYRASLNRAAEEQQGYRFYNNHFMDCANAASLREGRR